MGFGRCLENICTTRPRFARECVLDGGIEPLVGILRRESQVTGFKKLPDALGHAVRALLYAAATPAGLLALLRNQALLVTLVLQRRMLTRTVRCDLLEMMILILEGSHPGSRYPCSEETLEELADQLRVMLDPSHNLSIDVTQRVLRALRIALTQLPLPPNPVIESAMHAPLLHMLTSDERADEEDDNGIKPTAEAIKKAKQMHHDAAACVGLLSFDEETAFLFVDHGAIEALVHLLPDSRDDARLRRAMARSGVTPQEVQIEPTRRLLPLWRHSEIRAAEERYDLRLQAMAALRQIVVRCSDDDACIKECVRLDLVRRLVAELDTAPHRQLRCEVAIVLDAMVECSGRLASQLAEQGGTYAVANALLEIEAPAPKQHPMIDNPDLRKSYITPWAMEDAEPHGCTWPGSYAEALIAGECHSRPTSSGRDAIADALTALPDCTWLSSASAGTGLP